MEGVEGKHVLDYACGLGKWSIHIAQLGARVSGFDLSDLAIEHAKKRAAINEVSARFDVADATALPYPNDAFDIVAGIGALHHVIKYPGTGSELHRVMRPGAVAFFTENLGHNPLIQLARLLTMYSEREAGDVILTERMVRSWAEQFSTVKIEGHSLLFMVKRVLPGRFALLSRLARIDEVLLRRFPRVQRYCGEALIELRK
jgi:ubiquinone/menaquinone biosynthesis C-methylase UbiE